MAKKSNKKKVVEEKVKFSLLQWLDQRALLIISGFLLAFIPLYPKLPLFDIIPGYIVRVRLEDFLVGFGISVWLLQALRKKIEWKNKASYFILAYAVVGLLSSLSAIFITKTVPLEPLHVGKTLLHYFRYLEYFTLFFIVNASIKSKDDVWFLLKVVMTTIVGIAAYGVGQKYLYWPVYSTMNREFSKGLRLYLTEHARVQSTFGGHYDLAAYMVIVTPIVMSLLYNAKTKLASALLWVVFLLSSWLLMVSASRTSFLSFLVSAALIIVFFTLKQPKVKDKLSFFIKKSLQFSVVYFILLANFGADMYDRLLQTLEAYPMIWNAYQEADKKREEIAQNLNYENIKDFFDFKAEVPENSISTDELEEVLVRSDQQPTSEKPSDVYVDVPDIVLESTTSATGVVSQIEVARDRTYSENALKYGLSVAIRLDTLWPRAIAGFYRNPLLGSGYATLTKETTSHFTEAESTDNNFLRTLGETGLLGFITFYGLIIFVLYKAYLTYRFHNDNLSQALSIGIITGIVGLLINASYIDVFASSKVAFTFWAFTGMFLGYTKVIKLKSPHYFPDFKKK